MEVNNPNRTYCISQRKEFVIGHYREGYVKAYTETESHKPRLTLASTSKSIKSLPKDANTHLKIVAAHLAWHTTQMKIHYHIIPLDYIIKLTKVTFLIEWL